MEYLLSRIHKLNALTGVLERYADEAKDINLHAIKADTSDILAIAEEIVDYNVISDKKFKKTIDKD